MKGLGAPEPWMADAVCRETDPDLWFPELGSTAKAAKRICGRCPVAAECLAYAIEHQEMGIWGGTSEKQRRRIRAREVA